jgi:hypothetical protein
MSKSQAILGLLGGLVVAISPNECIKRGETERYQMAPINGALNNCNG